MNSDFLFHEGSFYGDYLCTDEEVASCDLLEGLEPDLMAAADLGRDMQGHVSVERKFESGNLMADLVTAADRRVQHAILEILSATPLRRCCLLAEEEEAAAADGTLLPPGSTAPDLRERFDASGPLFLTVDPIDGTKRYTEGKPWYSMIVGLHNGVRPLYTFIYYPALGWWMRLRGETATSSSPPPDDGLDLASTIVYTSGDPTTEIPALVSRLAGQGVAFARGESLGPHGSKYLLLTGQAGGYYACNPNLYDGLFGLHYGLAGGFEVTAHGRDEGEGFGGPLDLTRHAEGRHGWYYPGFYLVAPRRGC